MMENFQRGAFAFAGDYSDIDRHAYHFWSVFGKILVSAEQPELISLTDVRWGCSPQLTPSNRRT
jgi:hypothetical protein